MERQDGRETGPGARSRRGAVARGCAAVAAVGSAAAGTGIVRLSVAAPGLLPMSLPSAVIALLLLAIGAGLAVGAVRGRPVPRRPGLPEVGHLLVAGVVLAAAGWLADGALGHLLALAVDAWDPLGCHQPGGC